MHEVLGATCRRKAPAKVNGKLKGITDKTGNKVGGGRIEDDSSMFRGKRINRIRKKLSRETAQVKWFRDKWEGSRFSSILTTSYIFF